MYQQQPQHTFSILTVNACYPPYSYLWWEDGMQSVLGEQRKAELLSQQLARPALAEAVKNDIREGKGRLFHNWPQRSVLMRKVLEHTHADVFAFQEVSFASEGTLTSSPGNNVIVVEVEIVVEIWLFSFLLDCFK